MAKKKKGENTILILGVLAAVGAWYYTTQMSGSSGSTGTSSTDTSSGSGSTNDDGTDNSNTDSNTY